MKNVVRRLGVFFVTGFLLLAGCAPSGGDSNAEKFIVGMECAYAPYNWTTSTATDTSVDLGGGQHCDGFDVMVARKLAEGLGKELVIQKTSWDGLIPSLQSKQIDAIIAGMSPTEERKQEIAFSDVYYRGKFGVVVKADSPYANAKTVNDFAGAKLTAQLSTFHVDLLPQLVGAEALAPMKDFPTMTVAAKSGEITGFISDDATGPTIEAENPDLKFVILEGDQGLQVSADQTGVAVGLRKDDKELTEKINKLLAEMGQETIDGYMEAATAGQGAAE